MAGKAAALFSGRNIKIENAASKEEVNISIFGDITSKSWFDDRDTLTEVLGQIRSVADGKKVTYNIEIASPGGDFHTALTLHDILSLLKGKVITTTYGLTASSGTILGQSATKGYRRMGSNGAYLIHKVSGGVYGNENDLESALEMHRTLNNQLAELYASKTDKKTKADFEELMNRDNGNGIFLNAKEALEWGLIDEIVPGESINNSVKEYNEYAEKNNLKIYNKKEDNMSGIVKQFKNFLGFGGDDEVDEDVIGAKLDAKVEELKAEKERAELSVTNAVKPLEAKIASLEAQAVNFEAEKVSLSNSLATANNLLDEAKAESAKIKAELDAALAANEVLAKAANKPPVAFKTEPVMKRDNTEKMVLTREQAKERNKREGQNG